MKTEIGKKSIIELINKEDEDSFRLKRIAVMLRGKTEITKEVEVMMKMNLAYWANDASLDCLYGYVAGKVDEAFYMEEDKFEVVYEISYPIAIAIEVWLKNLKDVKMEEDELRNFESSFETDKFNVNVWYCEGLNDFSANITRKDDSHD